MLKITAFGCKVSAARRRRRRRLFVWRRRWWWWWKVLFGRASERNWVRPTYRTQTHTQTHTHAKLFLWKGATFADCSLTASSFGDRLSTLHDLWVPLFVLSSFLISWELILLPIAIESRHFLLFFYLLFYLCILPKSSAARVKTSCARVYLHYWIVWMLMIPETRCTFSSNFVMR